MNLPGQPVIVLATGRCGTSYLTSLLQANGVDIGTHLVAPHPINPHGFFENEEFVNFHMRLLAREEANKYGPLIQPLSTRDFTSDDEAEAGRLLQAVARQGVWGWKDPRTVHFIDSWLRILPQARLIIPIRHPLEVLYSYLKRIPIDVMFDPAATFFPAYARQYERTLAVVQRHAGHAYVLEVQAAFRQPEQLWRELARFLGIEDRPATVPPFHEDELTQLALTGDLCELFSLWYPEAARAFENLNHLASLGFQKAERARFDRAIAELLSEVRQAGALEPHEWLALLFQCALPPGQTGYFHSLMLMLAERVKINRMLTTACKDYAQHLENVTSRIAELEAERLTLMEEASRAGGTNSPAV